MVALSLASASSCSASTLTSGGCGKATKIGVVVGVITTGALVVAGLFLIWYCARRRPTWLGKHTRVKRLLREAAGNSSVPFYPYKEIEKATNSFSEKHRLGTGAFGTVYAGKLHNDEWVAIKNDMRPTMMEVAEELEHIRLSGWATMEETVTASSIGSTSSSPRHGSEKSLSRIKNAGQGSERLIVPQNTESFLHSMEVDSSPVSVHDRWSSRPSSPSSNSLLGNVIP
ncbi:Wall-associated receptor kinase 14 [Spatholobus suberectus]|nr:Wall-associated receptor kinase 14 [Spatholobus suberectus]